MDATLIAASPSTKNEVGRRDPDMSQSKKGNQRYFGPPLVVCKQTTARQRKTHTGGDAKSGLIHTVKTTTLREVVTAGPDPEIDGAVRWRCSDLVKLIKERFDVDYHVNSI